MMLKHQGVTYFAHANTSAHIPTVTILTLDQGANQSWSEEVVKVILPMEADSLQDGMRQAIMSYLGSGEDVFTQKENMKRSIDAHDSVENNTTPKKSLEGLSLFDNIMENANAISYDPAIGRYIDKDTVHLSPNKDIIKSDISYGTVMVTQKEQMTEIVSKTRSNRDRQATIAAKRAALHRDDVEYSLHQNKVIIDPPQECALCEKEYKLSRLLGSVTFKAVAEWRAAHAAPLPATDKRFVFPHDSVRLCLLCSCFFDPGFSDCLDEPSIHESVGLSVDRIMGVPEESNRNSRMMLKEMAHLGEHISSTRPLSAIRTSIDTSQLKLHRDTNGDSSSKFLYNYKDPDVKMFDQSKGGNYLKEKYADIIKVKQQQNKGDIEARLKAERAKRRDAILNRFSTSGDSREEAKENKKETKADKLRASIAKLTRQSQTAGSSPKKRAARGSRSRSKTRRPRSLSTRRRRRGASGSTVRSQALSTNRAAKRNSEFRPNRSTGDLSIGGRRRDKTARSLSKGRGQTNKEIKKSTDKKPAVPKFGNLKKAERKPLVLVVDKKKGLGKGVVSKVVSATVSCRGEISIELGSTLQRSMDKKGRA